MHSADDGLTVLLHRWERGDQSAAEAAFPLIYDDLRAIAGQHLRRERPNHTLQKTALIHEVYLRLLDQRAPDWESREHFFAMAGTLMRRILVDHARRRGAEKRGEGIRPSPLDGLPEPVHTPPHDVIALADALTDLERFDPQKARVVELRFFMGLSMDEIAAAMGISVRTIHREWTVARAWLQAYLSERD